MYTSFFGLSEKPFAITPNPRFLYMSQKHAEALAHLTYGLTEAGGFVQLTGEVGMGKTMLVRALLQQLPEHADVALILNPRLSATELLLAICEELGIFLADGSSHSVKDLVDELNAFLLTRHAKNRRVVVIIDEAQNLLPDTLEQVRLLTNLETETQKLLQILLIGQPELRDLLARNDLRQLAQRITGRYHLSPLDADDTAGYVQHRLKVAGADRELFSPAALRAVHHYSGGVPRLINIICDRALLGAFTRHEAEVSKELVASAAQEVAGEETQRHRHTQWLLAAVAMVVLVVALLWWQRHPVASAVTVTPMASSSASSTSVASILDAAQLLNDPSLVSDTNSAFSALFGLWNLNYVPGAVRACDQAKEQGLECVYQRGSWGLLRTLNRPAILQLSDDTGRAHQLVIATLTQAEASVWLDGRPRTVTVASLSRYWNGDFLILWRAKVTGQKALVPGMTGKDVLWLRQSLTRWNNRPFKTKVAQRYDDELANQVSEFQKAVNLTADGMAGLQTQVALDAATRVDNSPLLQPVLTSASGQP